MDRDFGRSVIYELVAQGDVRFLVHKDILASQSAPFHEAMSGEWSEASERKFNLEDWDSDTVARMVQFLYKGDYQYPKPTPIHDGSVPCSRTPSEHPGTSPADDLDRPLTPLGDRLTSALSTWIGKPVPSPTELDSFTPEKFDFNDALLCHAKVYAFAHYKSIDALRNLAYHRLLATLAHIDPIPSDSHLAVNFVEFASYAYSNTDSLVSTAEPLRELIAQFTALNFKALRTAPEAVELMGKGGDLVMDVMGKICRMLPDREPRGGGQDGKRFVSGIKVIRNHGQPPTDHIPDKAQGLSNLNHPYTGTMVWLVAEYTTTIAEACTSFTVSFDRRQSGTQHNIAVDYSMNCYLDPVKDRNSCFKITEVAFLRSNSNTAPTYGNYGYTGAMGEFISPWVRQNCYGWLVWKTAKVARG